MRITDDIRVFKCDCREAEKRLSSVCAISTWQSFHAAITPRLKDATAKWFHQQRQPQVQVHLRPWTTRGGLQSLLPPCYSRIQALLSKPQQVRQICSSTADGPMGISIYVVWNVLLFILLLLLLLLLLFISFHFSVCICFSVCIYWRCATYSTLIEVEVILKINESIMEYYPRPGIIFYHHIILLTGLIFPKLKWCGVGCEVEHMACLLG